MTACLLCPSPAVADCLCVPCGAKLWAANVWIDDPPRARKIAARDRERIQPEHKPRYLAIRDEITNLWEAEQFVKSLEAARAERAAKDGER